MHFNQISVADNDSRESGRFLFFVIAELEKKNADVIAKGTDCLALCSYNHY